MRTVTNALEVIENLISPNDRILFNLFYLIAESPASYWVTDDKSYLVGQTNEHLPMWIWINDSFNENSKTELASIIWKRLALNPRLKLTADASKISTLLEQIAAEKEASLKSTVPMNIYCCQNITNSKTAPGHVIKSNIDHKNVLQKFITGMVNDLEHRPMKEGEAKSFADAVTCSDDLFLWEDGGTVVSMAMIAHETNKYARINTVYTDSCQRGKGYAGMLVGKVTEKILAEGKIPMLYTEQDNLCSNAVYKRIGYQLCGKLTQFCFLG